MRLTREQLAEDLSRVAAGDLDAFLRVYNATSRKLYGIVVRILGRADLADEVLQEVYIRIWQNAGSFETSRASPITWMAIIARNRALDVKRRRPMSRLDDVAGLLELPSDEDIVAEHIDLEELRRLQACLRGLEDPQKEVLQLVYYQGMTRQDAATRTGQSVFAVRKWLKTGLADLKRCLER